jgi:hypothetical protein
MEFDALLKALLGDMTEQLPDVALILDEAKQDGLSETETMARLVVHLSQNPDQAKHLDTLAMAVMQPLRDGDTVGIIQREGKLPQVNPKFEAALLERLQFDGDVPEFRSTPLQNEAPAVPVDTVVRNPVALGKMLEGASAIAKEAVEKCYSDQAKLLESSDQEEVGLSIPEKGLLDPKVYRRGEMAKPMEVETPKGASLLALTSEERKKSAWKFLSTTQGRKSALRALAELVLIDLKKYYEDIQYEPNFDLNASKEEIAGTAEWTVNLGGALDTQASFSFVDTAANALALKLRPQSLDLKDTDKVILEITPINTVDIRSVGWGARLRSVK